MKLRYIFLLLFLTLTLFSESYIIIDLDKGAKTDLEAMVKDFSNNDIIFFGEHHDSKVLHKLEREILPLMMKYYNDFAVSMEMFERDVQSALNSYLENAISEEEMLKKTRAWHNYKTAYKPIIEFSKENNIDVIAANVPRRYASKISKLGPSILEKLGKKERKYVADSLVVMDDGYKKKFIKTMKDNHMMSGKMSKMINMDWLYAAQCIKDDTMAESIDNYYRNNNKKIIHFNGVFHSADHLGTAQKLKIMNNNLSIAIITPIKLEDAKPSINAIDLKKNNKNDFIILYKE